MLRNAELRQYENRMAGERARKGARIMKHVIISPRTHVAAAEHTFFGRTASTFATSPLLALGYTIRVIRDSLCVPHSLQYVCTVYMNI